MKIGLYTDPHFSQTSSIIVGKSGDFSGRLTNLINSFKWMNDLFKREGCEMIFCLGDLTDKPNLTAEEITAMSQCGIEDHYLIVGNHCRLDKDGKINSLSIFKRVYHEPTVFDIDGRKVLILPYNNTAYSLKDFGKVDVIFSHNDIKGYDFGSRVSEVGYEIEDIMSSCQLFINGHLHNGGWLIEKRIVNLGQLSGMNFSSCGGQWEPSVGILDTESLELNIFENPCAYRFKKEEFSTLVKLKSYLDNLPSTGNYVLQVKVPEIISQKSRSLIDKNPKVVASRIIVVKESNPRRKTSNKTSLEENNSSIFDKLRNFVNLQNPSKYSLEKISEIIENIERREESSEQ